MLLPASWVGGPNAARLEGWEQHPAPLPRTALRVGKGEEIHWQDHLARLREGATLLGWDTTWLHEAFEEAKRWGSESHQAVYRLRVHPGALQARLDILPTQSSPYGLLVLPHPLGDLRRNDRAQIKGLLGAWDQKVLKVASQKGAADVLLTWPDGTLAETAISACGFLREGTFRMPPLEGRVQSISEARDLPRWAKERGWTLTQGPVPLAEIRFGKIWCMNAVRGLWQADTIQF